MSDTTIKVRYFVHDGDDYISVMLDGEELIESGYEELGPEGFYVVENLARRFAEATGFNYDEEDERE